MNTNSFFRGWFRFLHPPLPDGVRFRRRLPPAALVFVSGLAAFSPAPGAPPVIVTPPHKLTAAVTGTARFQAAVTGDGPVTNFWYHEGERVSATGDAATLTLTNVQESDRGRYWLAACNADGCVTSAPVVLTVMPRSGTEFFDPVVNNGAGSMPGLQYNFGMHSDHLVPVFARGRGSELFAGYATNVDRVRGPYLDNTDVNKVMRSALSNGVKNVIVMVSDGAGFSTYEATSYYQHGELGRQVYDAWPVQGACSTYPLNTLSSPTTNTAPPSTRGWYDQSIWLSFFKGTSNWTDSSAAGTALSSGRKTYNFSIGWSDDNQPLPNIAEAAKQIHGRKVGIVTTVPISHATPGAFSAHNRSRMAFAGIAADQLTNTLVDVLIGAGHPLYDEDNRPAATVDYNYVGGPDLWNSLVSGALGWELIQTRDEFAALAQGTLCPTGRLCGIAQVRTTLQQARSSSAGGREAAFAVPFNTGVPDLPTLSLGALQALSAGNSNGFFMMIEGGAIDLANHAGQPGRMIEEQIDFNHAVKTVEDWVTTNGGWTENLVVVVTDHETGLIFGPTAGGVPTARPASLNPSSGIASLATAHSTVDLSWAALSGVTGYRVKVIQPDQTVVTFDTATNRFAFTNSGTGTYVWSVTPLNAFGPGPESASASFTVLLHGLVGVGRVPCGAFDARGPGLDTLGGIGSAAFFDVSTWNRTSLGDGRYAYAGRLYCASDRGYGNGTQNYLARIQTLDIAIMPDYGTGAVEQTQVVLSNTATLMLTCAGAGFTGYDPDDASVPDHPQCRPDSPGQGHRSLDAEGLVRLADGSYFVSDEYGALIHKFSASGELEYTLWPPEALVPKTGAYPGASFFTAASPPRSGRRNNRGLEGLSVTPDGTRLFALLQSPTIQDGGSGNLGRNTRVLLYDIDPASPTCRQPVAEYVYVLTLNGSAATNRHTLACELLALNSTDFLVLERDKAGAGGDSNAPIYKRIVLASTVGATNIIDTAYDLEQGAPGQLSFGTDSFPTPVQPVRRTDLVDLLDTRQLVRFGLNISAQADTNTLPEKWESLALIPLNDPEATNDFLLLTMNDNDFLAPVVYHNGVAVGTNAQTVDTLALAYRISLPMHGTPASDPQPPGVFISSTNVTLSTTGTLTIAASAYAQSGRVVRVDFYENGAWIGASTNHPFQVVLPNRSPGAWEFNAVATDNCGLCATSSVARITAAWPDTPLTVQLARVIPHDAGSNTVILSFNTLIGKNYQVWAAGEIQGPWTNLTSTPIIGTGMQEGYTNRAASSVRTFYRILRVD